MSEARSSPGLLEREASILMSAGLTVHAIQALVAEARSCHADIFDHAIVAGLIDELTLYKAAADELGLPFTRFNLAIADDANPQDAMRAGIARLHSSSPQGRFVLAPRGAGLRHLLTQFTDMASSGGVMTTPQAFQEALQRLRQSAATGVASFELEKAEPKDSVRTLSYRWVFALLMAGLGLMSLLVAWTGTGALRWVSLALGFLFLLNVSVRLSAVIAAWDIPQVAPRSLPDHALPIYSVFVPLYREAAVIPQLIAALAALDYPRDRLDIQLLIEENDHETRDALSGLLLPGFMRITIVPSGQPQTKPRALNLGLALAMGALCTVYDAEDRPEPDQLRKAAAWFAVLPRDYACLQARLAIDHAGETWVTNGIR